MNNKKSNHKKELIELYKSQLTRENETEFMKIVLKNAIEKLENDINPVKVENWVVKLEKMERMLL